MLKTNQSYINEFSFFDNVIECIEESRREVDMAVYSYNNNKRQAELKSFFEGVMDDELFTEKEGEGVLAKIGNAILTLVRKVADFIRNTSEKLLSVTKKTKTDTEIVNKMMNEHPELRNEVVNGLEKEWFTYKDVAKFEKDVTGLIMMLDKNKIDHATFKDKFKKSCEDFTESGQVIISAGSTLSRLTSIIPKVGCGVKDCRNILQSFSKIASDIIQTAKINYNEHDVNKFQAIANALGQAIGIVTKECNDRQAGQGRIATILSNIKNSKVGQKLHLDDTSRSARHDRSRQNAENERVRKMQREVDKENEKARRKDERDKYDYRKYSNEYYQRMEDKLKREKEHNDRMKTIADNIKNGII